MILIPLAALGVGACWWIHKSHCESMDLLREEVKSLRCDFKSVTNDIKDLHGRLCVIEDSRSERMRKIWMKIECQSECKKSDDSNVKLSEIIIDCFRKSGWTYKESIAFGLDICSKAICDSGVDGWVSVEWAKASYKNIPNCGTRENIRIV